MSTNKIQINGDALSTVLDTLKSNLKDFENELISLSAVADIGSIKLTGEAYTKFFETVNKLVQQQKDILITEQLIQEKIVSFVSDMQDEEKRAKRKFKV